MCWAEKEIWRAEVCSLCLATQCSVARSDYQGRVCKIAEHVDDEDDVEHIYLR
jgi:hypothetical protein